MGYPRNMGAVVDELGVLQQERKRLQAREAELKGVIIRFAGEAAASRIIGDDYIATVRWQDRAVTNWQGMVAMLQDRLNIPSELISDVMGACTTINRKIPGVVMAELSDSQRAAYALRRR